MRRAVVWTAILFLGACGGSEALPEDEADAPMPPRSSEVTSNGAPVRGFLVLGPEVRSLKPCEQEGELWVIPTPEVIEVYEALSGAAYEAVFVEVDATVGPPPASGFGADYSGLLTMRELRRAEPSDEGVGCDESLDAFAFRATGQEPFWHLRVGPERMVLSTPSVPETVFAGTSPTAASGGWNYLSESAGPESLTIVATFVRGRCSDSMSGAVYSWTAEVALGDDTVRGCAWEGGLAPR